MAQPGDSGPRKPQGNEPEEERPRQPLGPGADPQLAGLTDLARRIIGLGLSGVFSTQETIRQAVGDALPKEWVDFAAEQSERTRAEFLERLAGELARAIENIDFARVVQQALEGRTLEVNARIRMLPDEGDGARLSFSMVEDSRK